MKKITVFCSNNMLYPKENKEDKILLYAVSTFLNKAILDEKHYKIIFYKNFVIMFFQEFLACCFYWFEKYFTLFVQCETAVFVVVDNLIILGKNSNLG